MTIPTGNVVIAPASDKTINLMPAGTSPLSPVIGLTGGPLTKWNITAVTTGGTTLYVFNVADQANLKLSTLQGHVFASTSQPAVEFAIEPADNGAVRIRVPGQDQFWKMEKANVPVNIRAKDTSIQEQWLIASVP